MPDGEILVWVTDGRLSAIEYAWWSDAAPDGLPDLSELRFGEVATAQSDLDGARPLRRLVGFTIDFVVLTVAYRVVILPICGGDRVLAVSPWLALAFVYFAVPVLVWSKTLGDWICRMRVVAVDQRLGSGRSSLRAAVTIAVIVTLNSYPVPIIELAVVALLGLGVWRTPARRTLLELASRTTVING